MVGEVIAGWGPFVCRDIYTDTSYTHFSKFKFPQFFLAQLGN